MARKKKKSMSPFKLFIIVCFINLALYGVFNITNLEKYLGISDIEEDALVKDVGSMSEDSGLTIHFIDVGQGDCILISESGKYMLIDAGKTSASEGIIKYLNQNGVDKFEYVIATHAHEDHIGSMSGVIKNFKIENMLVSKYTASTRVYENFILAAKEKNLTFYAPTVGEKFTLGNATFTILADGNFESDNMNNHSIVIRMEYGENSFIFMGDAEEEVELKIMENSLEYASDVIKIGHHGSDTSTSKSFLKGVNPDYAIISCGANNNYGHPCKSVMQRLKIQDVVVYRTDENSTIILKSDGENITFNVQPGTYSYISAN